MIMSVHYLWQLFCSIPEKVQRGLVTALCLLSLANVVQAQSSDDWRSWPLGERFAINVEAFFPKIDTVVRLDAADGSPGTTIDFEQNLGMSDTETLPAVGFAWRFAKKHKIAVDWFDLSRSGSSITTSEIRFGDEVFQVDLPVSSFFDIRVTSIEYSYSLIFDEKKELALSAGLSAQEISFGLIRSEGAGVLEVESGMTAPVPAFGLVGGYAFSDKWVGKLGLGVFSFSLDLSDEEDLSGDIFNAYAAIQHRTFEKVHFGLRYAYFDIDVDFSTSGRVSSVNYEYHGPQITFSYVY